MGQSSGNEGLRVGKAGHGSRAGCDIPHRLLEAAV